MSSFGRPAAAVRMMTPPVKRFLDDLDEDLLPLAEQLFDLLRRPVARIAALLAVAVVLARFELLEFLERVDDVGHVEEAVALETDVDERRLHAGQHLRHPALVDVAGDAALPFPLDEDFSDQVVFENGDDGFVAIRGDDHLLSHSRTPEADS